MGPCRDNFNRWFFDAERATCLPFIYGGCAGNMNRFKNFESCISFCSEAIEAAGRASPTSTVKGFLLLPSIFFFVRAGVLRVSCSSVRFLSRDTRSRCFLCELSVSSPSALFVASPHPRRASSGLNVFSLSFGFLEQRNRPTRSTWTGRRRRRGPVLRRKRNATGAPRRCASAAPCAVPTASKGESTWSSLVVFFSSSCSKETFRFVKVMGPLDWCSPY